MRLCRRICLIIPKLPSPQKLQEGTDNMSVLLKALRGVCTVLVIISCAAILVLAALTTYNVVMRYILSRPVTGATEWSQMLLIISMLAMGIAVADGRAIRVGMVVDRFPKRVNVVFEIIMGFIALAFFTLVGWMLIARLGWLIERGKAYLYLGWPEWPLYLALGISFLSCALGTIVFAVNSIVNFKDAKEKDIFDENPDLAILALANEEEARKSAGGNGAVNSETGEVAE